MFLNFSRDCVSIQADISRSSNDSNSPSSRNVCGTSPLKLEHLEPIKKFVHFTLRACSRVTCTVMFYSYAPSSRNVCGTSPLKLHIYVYLEICCRVGIFEFLTVGRWCYAIDGKKKFLKRRPLSFCTFTCIWKFAAAWGFSSF